MSYFSPITPRKTYTAAELDRLVAEGKMRCEILCVCYICGAGPHNKQTLFRVGKTKGDATVYGCAANRGLRGMTQGGSNG